MKGVRASKAERSAGQRPLGGERTGPNAQSQGDHGWGVESLLEGTGRVRKQRLARRLAGSRQVPVACSGAAVVRKGRSAWIWEIF